MLVTTLTKRMAEDLTEYYAELGVRVRYLHSDIDTLERIELLRDLRAGEYDVLVGINLLREGLDLPEVSLVAILDADKEGFLRSARSLIQTIGRAARNARRPGDHVRRPHHRRDEARHRRDEPPPRDPERVQREARHHAGDDQARDPRHQSGERHHATTTPCRACHAARRARQGGAGQGRRERRKWTSPTSVEALRQQMFAAAENLQFETAAQALRDELRRLQDGAGGSIKPSTAPRPPDRAGARGVEAQRAATTASRKRR